MAFWDKWFGRSKKQKIAEAEAKAEADRARRLAEAALVKDQDNDAARLAADRRLRRMGQRRGLASTDVGGSAGKTLLGQ